MTKDEFIVQHQPELFKLKEGRPPVPSSRKVSPLTPFERKGGWAFAFKDKVNNFIVIVQKKTKEQCETAIEDLKSLKK